MTIPIIILSFFTTLLLTPLVKKSLLRRNLLDTPNERSSHTTPVPRGGGWAILFTLIPTLVWMALIKNESTESWLLAGLAALAGVSWYDDKHGLSAKTRLYTHLFAALFGTLALPEHATLFNNTLPFFLDRTVMILGWAWFMNLYNFMDGIDGITGAETVAIATGTCTILSATGITDPFVSTLTLILTGSSLGFLAYNWHPAKIFLGDIGSVPLGYLTGFCLLFLVAKGQLAPALILPLYYLADSGITITRRALRGEKIWQAHRQHFYQKAAQNLGHDKTVLRITIANIALILTALLAIPHPAAGLILATLIVALLLRNMHISAHVQPTP
jgi:UDP-N-acetylmuramyl pentapeptide phosphotransferase/UDP-N-acetylglucosamine-1-phosphate transferase